MAPGSPRGCGASPRPLAVDRRPAGLRAAGGGGLWGGKGTAGWAGNPSGSGCSSPTRGWGGWAGFTGRAAAAAWGGWRVATPKKAPRRSEENSPHRHVLHITTPVLVIHGE